PELPASAILAADSDCIAELSSANPTIAASEDGREMATVLGSRDMSLPELHASSLAAFIDRRRLAVMPRSALRRALVERVSPRLTAFAVQGLADWRPDYSARNRITGKQGIIVGATLALLAVFFWSAPVATFIAIHLAGSTFFVACSGLKAMAVAAFAAPRARRWRMPADTSDMPVYTVLVALHREAEIVPQLLVALGQLVWPRDKLEIKLVCEADDRATIDAIRTLQPRSYVEVIEVAPSLPRTKPKALRFAMTMITGEFVVLYDAEDRPHPHQLLEAYARFLSGDRELACLQAPLAITNGRRSLLARMFAVEYAGLFNGFLPWLASRQQPLPLGGTSNHFRRAALEAIGGWDPHNVTEDADVGVRLYREGFRAETIALPTLEAAPEEIRVWLPQRTRWLKGWLATWLVHMRHPSALLAEVGPLSFVTIQIVLAGMFFSALLHPVLFVSAAVYAVMPLFGLSLASWQYWLLGLDFGILLFSYGVFLILGWRAVGAQGRKNYGAVVAATPFYWLLLSYAAWLALLEFLRHPHRWNKTPHKPG
ncbi:glycosyltransferase, partial [Salmonella enterica subsp. enterica]|nr:glycosyltransferase [Salmonella enterica subsp. enterica serovar Enteritidis]